MLNTHNAYPKRTIMTPHTRRPCNLTVRLAEDMTIRNLAHRTIDAYTFHVARFADFIQKPLDRVTPEDVRAFQLHLIQVRKLAYSSFNQAVCALRFLYTHTIRVNWPVTMVPYGKRPKTLPVVLARDEVDQLLQCTANLKQRTFLTLLYATGMRFNEAAHLKITDIDSARMQIRILHGKGNKQRQVPLSPRLLSELRSYWKAYRPSSLLFPGKSPNKTYCDTTIQLAIKDSAAKAGITKHVTPHTLRHSYATGLLEAGVDLLTISKLLGHASFATTMVYLHCRREHLMTTPSPLDWLPVQQLPTYQPPVESPQTSKAQTSKAQTSKAS
jgi:integrase/recombinase XerD